jgi:hypothetical protein
MRADYLTLAMMIEQPVTTRELIEQLKLVHHPEGGEPQMLGPEMSLTTWIGYYALTDLQRQHIPSPFASECHLPEFCRRS